jgi:hypothetical protein
MSIEKNLSDKSIPVLIFHEGNITMEQQKIISTATPQLIIVFIVHLFKKENEATISLYEPSRVFGDMNYRHMCCFWFCDFWDYLGDYDKVLRIDEDCVINFSVDEIFRDMEKSSSVAVYGKWTMDDVRVTFGLNKFTRRFLETNNQPYHTLKKKPSGPYTNVIALNLALMRENALFKSYVDAVKQSDNIYVYRHGDLPLWGDALYYLFPNRYMKSKKIKYYHGSHNVLVNLF